MYKLNNTYKNAIILVIHVRMNHIVHLVIIYKKESYLLKILNFVFVKSVIMRTSRKFVKIVIIHAYIVYIMINVLNAQILKFLQE